MCGLGSDLQSKLLSLWNDGWIKFQFGYGIDQIHIHAAFVVMINLVTQLICVRGVYLIISGRLHFPWYFDSSVARIVFRRVWDVWPQHDINTEKNCFSSVVNNVFQPLVYKQALVRLFVSLYWSLLLLERIKKSLVARGCVAVNFSDQDKRLFGHTCSTHRRGAQIRNNWFTLAAPT